MKNSPLFQVPLPVREIEAVQLGPSSSEGDYLVLSGKDVIVVWRVTTSHRAGFVVPDPEWIVAFIPLNCSSDFTFNGLVPNAGDAFLSATSNGYSTAGHGRETIAIGVRKSAFEKAAAAMSLLHHEDLQIRDLIFSVRTQSGRDLVRLIHGNIRFFRHNGIEGKTSQLSAYNEAQILSETVSAILESLETMPDCVVRPPNALRVVRLAEAAMMRHPEQPLSLAEMCSAAAVSKAWLHRCFEEIYGVSPVQFMRLWRMTAARQALLQGCGQEDLVKQVALRFGFWHSGRFATEYRSMFGELPSQTIHRPAPIMA